MKPASKPEPAEMEKVLEEIRYLMRLERSLLEGQPTTAAILEVIAKRRADLLDEIERLEQFPRLRLVRK